MILGTLTELEYKLTRPVIAFSDDEDELDTDKDIDDDFGDDDDEEDLDGFEVEGGDDTEEEEK